MRHRYWHKPNSDNSDKVAGSDSPEPSKATVVDPSSSQISDKNKKNNTSHRQPPKAIRCDLGKTSESSEQLANFFDGAVVLESQSKD